MAKKKTKKTTLITPLGERVLLRELTDEEAEKTTDSGIIIPETVSKEDKGARRGKIVAVGEGRLTEEGKRLPMSVKEGQTVLFSWGDEIKIDDDDYWVVNESNILGIIN